MDVLLLLGAWGAGSVVVSLAVGAVVARADRTGSSAPGRALPASATAAAALRELVDAR